MRRRILGFHQDDLDDWIADLDCLHAQHVRHQPPLFPRPWAVTATGRDEHIGTVLDCPLCDRAELPDGLSVERTAGPFDESTLPMGLSRAHRVAGGTWGLLKVLAGEAHFAAQTDPPIDRVLLAGDVQPIPPDVLHAVGLNAGTVAIDFLVASSQPCDHRDVT